MANDRWTGDVLKVGTFVPFTGPPGVRVNGPRLHAGTAIGLRLFNEKGGFAGRSVELIAEDNGYDTEITTAAARKLVERDQVFALLNANGTPQISALLPYLEEHRMPILLPFGGDEHWYHPPRRGLLGLSTPFNDTGVLLGRWAAAEGHRRVVVFHPDAPSISPLMAEYAARSYREASDGGVAELLCVRLTSEEGGPMADAIERLAPDAIIVLTNWPELRALTTELRNRGLSFPMYSWAANVSQDVVSKLGDLIEGMKGYSPLIAGPLSDVPAVRTFREALARDFPDQEPDFISLHAFAHTLIFAEALNRVQGVLTQDALFEAFHSLKAFETGILPPVTFAPDRHMGAREIQPMQLTGGVWALCGAPETLPLEAAL